MSSCKNAMMTATNLITDLETETKVLLQECTKKSEDLEN
jgi:hypothetical protein